MTEQKQIEEMAEAIFKNCHCGLFFSEAEKIADFVINQQGYRKQIEGEWVKPSASSAELCSECGRSPNMLFGILPPYCPNCGAKMKGDEGK